MSNELALSLWQDEKKLEEIRKIYAPEATDFEFQCLVGLGIATGLNPFLKEVWFVKIDKKAQIFIGRDGYRKGAQRNPLYDYHQADAVYDNDKFDIEEGIIHHSYNLKDRGILVGAYCIVQRKGATKPIYQYVELNEYAKKIKEYDKNSGKFVERFAALWKDKPATMIKKVAEAQTLRMAFQDVFGGTYDETEDWRTESTKQIDEDKIINVEPLFSLEKVLEITVAMDNCRNINELKKIGDSLNSEKFKKSDLDSLRMHYKEQKLRLEKGDIIDEQSVIFAN